MESKSFIDLLIENDENHIKEWVKSNGKRAKPVSPIFYIDDLPEDEAALYKNGFFPKWNN